MKWTDYCAHRNQIGNIGSELLLSINLRGGVCGDFIQNKGRVSLHQKDAQSLEWGCQPPRVSTGRGMKCIPWALQSSQDCLFFLSNA